MSSKLPFEDAFKNKMNDLPTGNEDASWQKMKALLEEKDKRKPFAWINIYSVCTCIMIVAGFCIWMILSDNKKDIAVATTNKEKKTKQLLTPAQSGKTSEMLIHENSIDTVLKQMNMPVIKANSNVISSLNRNRNFKISNDQHSVQKNQTKNNKDFITDKERVSVNKIDSINTISKNNFSQLTLDSLQNSNANIRNEIDKNYTDKIMPVVIAKSDSAKAQINITNSLKNNATNDTNTTKKQIKIVLKTKKQYFVEAGIQLKQQIPLPGQKIISYNYNGNKNLFSDYAPSASVKFEKDKQWFLQGEFNYASPHLVKQFSYSRQTKADYSLSTVTTTNLYLQKTYYDEIPVSFNYYVQPRWLIGAGVTFSWFRGAVAKLETATNDIKAGTYTNAAQMIPFKMFTDSFVYKNQTSLLFQTGYTLKRWSFTLRYERNLQPFIRYTLPDGIIDNKKNTSLELLVGYDFIKTPGLRLKKKK